ncbi:14478_t:CDS:10 [Entrophospora sp. SA101]|nr:14478_t:CDS:10 [Entrophospora sp. SA101]
MPPEEISTDSATPLINLSSSNVDVENEIIDGSSDHDVYNFIENGDKLIEAEVDTGDVQSGFSWSKLWKYTGPEADLQTGAVAGYSLLWLLLYAHLAGLLIQCLSARVGVVTGKHLAQLIRQYYSRPVSILLWVITEIAIVGSDIQEIVGTAIALKIIFGLPLWIGTMLTAMDTFTFMLLQNYGVRKLEAFFMFLIGLMAVCFWIEMFQTDPDVGGIITGMLLPSVPSNAVIQAVAMIGAVMTRKTDQNSKAKLKEANFYFGIESTIALLCSYLINMAIVVVFARVFYPPSSDSPHLPGLYDAADVLTKTLGKGARYLWALGLLAAGQSSTMTGTLAGQYVMEGFFGKLFIKNSWNRVAITRGIALIPSMMVAIFAVEHFDTMGELLNVLQSLCLPTALIPILKISSSANIMSKKELPNLYVGFVLGIIYFAFVVYLTLLPLNENNTEPNDINIENLESYKVRYKRLSSLSLPMTKTSPRRIPPRREDSSREAAFIFLSNISLGSESSYPPNNNNLRIDTKKANIPFEKVSNNNATTGIYVTSQTRKSPNKKIFNNNKTSPINLKDGYDDNLNSSSNKGRVRSGSLHEEAAVNFLTNIINLDPNKKPSKVAVHHHSSRGGLTSPTTIKQSVSGFEASDDNSFDEVDVDGAEDQQRNLNLMIEGSLSPTTSSAYVKRRRRSSASTLKSDTSSSSSTSNTSPNSPNHPITRSKSEQRRLRKHHNQADRNKNNNNSSGNDSSAGDQNVGDRKQQNGVGLFLGSSAPLGIFSMLGYSDKKSKHQKNHRGNFYRKPSSNLENIKSRKAESFAHLLNTSKALSSKQVTSNYDPNLLDNPELKTERQLFSNEFQEAKSNKNRSMLSLSGFMGTFINHNTRPSDLKRETNAIFRQLHPEIDPSLTLSQIRKIKAKLFATATCEDLDLELSTVAKSYAYFEKLVLKNVVKKNNRKLIGAICLLLASKVNEPMGMSYSPLLESLHKRLEVTTKEIIEQEFSVFSSLEFELYLHSQEYMPHLEKLFDILSK